MGWDWRRDMDRARYTLSLSRPLLPFLIILALLASNFTRSGPLRFGALILVVLFCLYLAADFARLFLDPDRNKPGFQGRPTPITTVQIVFSLLMAVAYTLAVLVAMRGWLGFTPAPDHIVPFVAVTAGTFLLCLSAAWQNVRLWYRQGAEYEDHLKEAEEFEAERAAGRNGSHDNRR
jgi:hypothetical protein